MRKWLYTKDDYEACASMGMTKAETSRYLGVSPQSVLCAAKKHGIEFKRKCNRGGDRVSPEQEEQMGKMMKVLAVEENKALRRRMGILVADEQPKEKPKPKPKPVRKRKRVEVAKPEPKVLDPQRQKLIENLEQQKRELEQMINQLYG